MADLFPDGFRRVIANALTGDRSILAPRLEADALGRPLLDTAADSTGNPLAKLYPKGAIGWPSFWPSTGAETCFARQGRDACTDFTGSDTFGRLAPAHTASIDPQIGWEVQKFLVVMTMVNIPANQKSSWMDMMRIFRAGPNANPEIDSRIEWQDPTSGQLYYASTYGTECLFGDAKNACNGGKGVAEGHCRSRARVCQRANE